MGDPEDIEIRALLLLAYGPHIASRTLYGFIRWAQRLRLGVKIRKGQLNLQYQFEFSPRNEH